MEVYGIGREDSGLVRTGLPVLAIGSLQMKADSWQYTCIFLLTRTFNVGAIYATSILCK